MTFLLDTNVLSELKKIRSGTANAGVARWADSVELSAMFISAVTAQEIEIGVLRLERRDIAQGRAFRSWFEDQVLPAFSGRILPVDLHVARRSARLNVPDVQPYHDALIAATALVHGMTVVTRNENDFRRSGVALLNPWTA